eukprot:m.21007 g.21007  ORF g.21007 m.21007 type:complete len:103 (-) comp32422_c0_seq1:73-381(-)
MVYKIGASTGLTTGTLKSIKTTISGYSNAICVSWIPGINFATSGDCGALYFIEFESRFVPIAIHVNTVETAQGTVSIGLELISGLEFLTPEICFKNPPYAAS